MEQPEDTDAAAPLSEATTTQIQSLPLEQLEALSDALLDFRAQADLTTWLAANT
nr:DUF4351 domain-containing protein [Cyanobium sp. Alchichica 3B3-8F6]